MEPVRPDHPLRRLFAGLVDNAFCSEIGVCDPALTEYLADLLVAFTHVDRLNAVRRAQGKRLEQIATMLAILSDELSLSAEQRDRTIYRHIGDYTLFWAGVYPEFLKRATRRPAAGLVDYVAKGKRSYAIVSDLSSDEDEPPSSLFRQLSEEFESCVHGLGLVRRGWEDRRLYEDRRPRLLF